MDFRLLRLILIDSYSPGRVVEFPVAGGAVLTGRNGRGKTTLLQLVPIFYGENPARIVGTETNRLDFNGYYLSRLTSYICFEYQRRIFIAFINRIRRQASVEVVWALDELKDLDIGNIEALLGILRRNAITLVSAFPDPDAEVLALFQHRFSVEEGRRLLEARVLEEEEMDAQSPASAD